MAPLRELSTDASLKLFNHSPTGFEWGYGGSGPAQLALAILLDFTRDPVESLKLHQSFKFMVIAGLEKDEWLLTEAQITTAIGKIKADIAEAEKEVATR